MGVYRGLRKNESKNLGEVSEEHIPLWRTAPAVMEM